MVWADALRKGWCPGALRPMAAKDGLLVRLRLTGGIIPGAHARAIADLAQRFGNSLMDLSARGNLQLRGLTDASWPALIDELQVLGVVDHDAAAEAVRNVIASPMAGLHDGLDIRPLVDALESELVTEAELHRLPAKFGFLIDDGTQPSLASVTADVRFDWMPAAGMFSIGLGGTRARALRIGSCPAERLISRASRVALGAIALFWEGDAPRRLRGLIDALGPDAVAAACGGVATDALDPPSAAPAKLAGTHRFQDRPVLGLAVPFGRLDAAMLRQAAGLASELRLTPWRTILLPDAAADVDLKVLETMGFIVNAADARLNIVACVGREGCARGTTPTHADSGILAVFAKASGVILHVSGCAKGCAQAERAAITLVGRDGLYDLVRHGRASDPPAMRGLDLSAVQAVLAL